jgi:uncharacterized damage-inducible protein DinB
MAEDHGTDWLSLKGTLLHIIWSEDSWINYSVQGIEDPNRPFQYSAYSDWNSITNYNSAVVFKVNKYLSNLTGIDLDKIISRTNNDGVKRTCKIMYALLHVLTEELHRRGETIAILWQMGIQPPNMGWLSAMKKTNPTWNMR